MNRQQAINYLISSGFSEEQINEIAKALEPTTKNDLGVDCIDRKMALDTIQMKWKKCSSGDDAMQESIDAIRVMPSVTPQLSSELEKNFVELDCISRADARSLICKIDRKYMFGMSGKAFQDLYKLIDELPSVTPKIEPKIGHWIEGEVWEDTDGGWGRWQKCSVCRQSKHHRTNFCPNCGCQMLEKRG